MGCLAVSTTRFKRCTLCGRWLPNTIDFFGVRNRRGRREIRERCRFCIAHLSSLYRAKTDYWNKRGRERQREYRRKRYRDDPQYRDTVTASHRDWGRRNPGIMSLYVRQRRKRMAGALPSPGELRALWDRQSGRCYYCGCELNDATHLDHYIPVAAGGSNSIENLRYSCPPCNQMKHTSTPDEFRERLGFFALEEAPS